MRYQLTIHPRSNAPIEKAEIHAALLAMGLEFFENPYRPELIDTGISLIEIIDCQCIPAGIAANVMIPYGRTSNEICDELELIAMIAKILNGDLLDGKEVIDVSEDNLLAGTWSRVLFAPVLARYLRASRASARKTTSKDSPP